jgi:hypothetical protein
MTDIFSSFLNTTVTVRPSNEQLEAASRLVRYGDIERPLSETCPISMDRFSVDDQVRQINHCGHLFVPSQFDEWFQSNVRCPVCRFDVRNHSNSTSAPATNAATNAGQNAATNAARTNPYVDMSNNDIIFDLSNNEISNNLLNTIIKLIFLCISALIFIFFFLCFLYILNCINFRNFFLNIFFLLSFFLSFI